MSTCNYNAFFLQVIISVYPFCYHGYLKDWPHFMKFNLTLAPEASAYMGVEWLRTWYRLMTIQLVKLPIPLYYLAAIKLICCGLIVSSSPSSQEVWAPNSKTFFFLTFFFMQINYTHLFEWFLALLSATAQQSYCRHTGVRRPAVRRHRFLGNRQVDWHQILLTGTYPPYLQTFQILHFWFFTIFFRFR